MKRKKLTETVHPNILERAKASNNRYNEHLDTLRVMGYYKGADVSMETSTLMVEAASILHELEGLKNGN